MSRNIWRSVSASGTNRNSTVVITPNGIEPFLWMPLANLYGRRPVYLFAALLGFASALGSGYAKNSGQLIAARIFNGLFPAAMALGAATVVGMFFFHQRGRAMGVFTVMMTNGSHLAPIIGGLLGEYCSWRWTFKLAAILPSPKMAKYPSVIFPALYYASQYDFASVLPAVTVAHIFTAYFGWSTLVIGLAYGASLTIGGCLGEVILYILTWLIWTC